MHALYERNTVAGPEIAGVRLTAATPTGSRWHYQSL